MRRYFILILLAALLAGCDTGDSGYYDDDYYDDDDCYSSGALAVDDFYVTSADTQIFVVEEIGVLVNDYFYSAFLEFPETTAQGGILDGNQDGSFTYTPPPQFAGEDYFIYTLVDDCGESSAVVTITVEPSGGPGPNPGFFVDSALGNDTTGNATTGAPFATIGGALDDAGINAVIVVRPGNGQPYAGNVALLDGQQLIGQGFQSVTPQGTTRPILSGQIDLADDNVIRGLRFQNVSGDAISGDGSEDAVVSNCVFASSSNGGRAVSAEGALGDWVIAGNSIDDMNDAGVRLSSSSAGVLVAEITDNSITDCQLSAISLLAEDTSNFTAIVTDNEMSGNEPGFTFDVLVVDSPTFRLDLEDNANDDVYLLSTLNFQGLFQVENLSTLQQQNLSGTVVLDEDPGSNPITEIPNGTL